MMNIKSHTSLYFLLAFSVLVSFLFFSCQDFLDVQPDNRSTINSIDKVKQLLVGAYSSADYYEFAEILSDNADDKGPSAGEAQQTVNADAWNYVPIYSKGIGDQGSVPNYWEGAYHAIAQANQALEYISSLPEKEQGAYAQYKGEALAIRAYYHFMLVNFFGKHYDVNTAGSDLGIPYVVEVEKTLLKKYKRNTVQEVYDYAIDDLEQAVKLIKDDRLFAKPKFHFNTKAVRALAVRLYLFKQEWQKVIDYANQVLPEDAGIPIVLKNFNSPTYDNAGYQGQALWYGSGDNTGVIGENPSVLLVADGVSFWNRHLGSRYGFSARLQNDIFSPFYRRGLGLNSYNLYSRSNGVHVVLPKFWVGFEYSDVAARTGVDHINMPLFTNEEVLLSRAEAYAMLEDSIHALKDLSLFRQVRNVFGTGTTLTNINQFYNRFSDTVSIPSKSETREVEYARAIHYSPSYALPQQKTLRNLVRLAVDCRRADFWQEGLRWFDVRRLGIEVVRKSFDGSSGREVTLTLKPDDPRRQLPLPQEVVTQGLPQNPR